MLFQIVGSIISRFHVLIHTTTNKDLTEIAVYLSEHMKHMEFLPAFEHSGKAKRKEEQCMDQNENNLNHFQKA